MLEYLDLLKSQFSNRISLVEKREDIYQLLAPFYHEDGDMFDIFIEKADENGRLRVCDHGMTIMRLSYSYEIDTPNKERIFSKILSENKLNEDRGRLFIDAKPESLYPAVLQFAQAIGKVSNMSLYKREVIRSMFYEMLGEFVEERLSRFRPERDVLPIPERDDLEVDYSLNLGRKAVYILGIRDTSKARLATISLLEFQKAKLQFKSIAVHEDFDSLGKKDRKRITSAADNQFYDLDDFRKNGEEYIEREAA